jgi:predicted PurR-regulated permease PerM
VLGGLQLVGLWGIFLGPITAAFFYAMLKILNKKRLERPCETDESSQSVGEAA